MATISTNVWVFSLVFLALVVTSFATYESESTPDFANPKVAPVGSYSNVPKPKVEKPQLEKPVLTHPSYEPRPEVPTFEKPKLAKPGSYPHLPKPDVEKPRLAKPEPIPASHPRVAKPEVEKPNLKKPVGTTVPYVPKPEVEKPKVVVPETYPHLPKPHVEKPEKPVGKPTPVTYPYVHKPAVGKPKLKIPDVVVSVTHSHLPKPKVEKPVEKPASYPHMPKPTIEKPKTIAIQGLVYCQSGIDIIPIEGALAKVTCLAMKENGHETSPFTSLCNPTNKKGYFHTILPALKDGYKTLTECKVTIESCPLKTCNVPTDINKGISGALLGPYHLLPNNIYLYSVGPFIFTPKSKPINGGY